MNCLEVHSLQKTFSAQVFGKPRVVLKNVTFQVREGVTTGFIGVNGSGKTTTLKCLLGFILPDQGQIRFWGENLSNEIKSQIGYFPERPYLYEYLTTREYLQFHWNLASSSAGGFENRFLEVLDLVKLSGQEYRPLREFSKGMLQRVGIAQAILMKPRLLILDEPMSGLDPDGRHIVKKIIQSQQAQGVSIFFSSHLLGDMDELCQDLVVIDAGEILYQGDAESFAAKYEGDSRITFRDKSGLRFEIHLPKSKIQAELDRLRSQGSEIIKVESQNHGIEYSFEQLRHEREQLDKI
ncbi:MAG: ABC transporter ATP-binding protein [Oligoflexia bacterium]|nr:MAG: ABC transporter ATP-binding protein [Oligoflexia bacterium]